MDGDGHLRTHTRAPGHREDSEPFLLVIFSSDCGPLTDLPARERVTWSVCECAFVLRWLSMIISGHIRSCNEFMVKDSVSGKEAGNIFSYLYAHHIEWHDSG